VAMAGFLIAIVGVVIAIYRASVPKSSSGD
jgi:hypothetical protein